MQQTISLDEYNVLMNRVGQQISYYEAVLESNRYYIVMASGDCISLTFPRNNISHILGIHTEKLRYADIVRGSFSSYDILKKLINSDITYSDMKNTNSGFDISSLFSDHIGSKVEIFTDILKLRTDDIYCVIKYCSDRSYTTGEEKENSDYFIIRRHNNKKFSVLGIAKDLNRNQYVPVTSRLYDTYEDLSVFLNKIAKNQEVTYPCSFKIENYQTGFNFDSFSKIEEKLDYNKTLKEVAAKYNAIPSTGRDFLAILEKSLNNRQKNINNSSILSLIKESISAGIVIDKEDIRQRLDDSNIPSELELLIDSCNDLICSNRGNSESANNSYSSIQNENNDMKKELEALKQELLEAKEKANSLEVKNKQLTEENNSNVKKLAILINAYDSIR